MAIFYTKRVEGEYQVYTYLKGRAVVLRILIIGGFALSIVFTYSDVLYKEYVVVLSLLALLIGCILSAIGGVQQIISQAKSGTLFLKTGQERKMIKLDNGNVEVWIKTVIMRSPQVHLKEPMLFNNRPPSPPPPPVRPSPPPPPLPPIRPVPPPPPPPRPTPPPPAASQNPPSIPSTPFLRPNPPKPPTFSPTTPPVNPPVFRPAPPPSPEPIRPSAPPPPNLPTNSSINF